MYVTELAKKADVTAHVVRYYTQLKLLSPSRNSTNRYRKYRPSDVHRVKFIRRAKCLGFTLADVRDILRQVDRGESACPKARELMELRLQEHGERLRALVALHQRMTEAIELWKALPDAPPNGDSLCHLIEHVTKAEESDSDSPMCSDHLLAEGDATWNG